MNDPALSRIDAAGTRNIRGFVAGMVGMLFFVGGSIYEYQDLCEWQIEGGTRRLNGMTHMLYDIGGPKGVLAAGMLLAIAVGVWGASQLRRS